MRPKRVKIFGLYQIQWKLDVPGGGVDGERTLNRKPFGSVKLDISKGLRPKMSCVGKLSRQVVQGNRRVIGRR